MESIALISPCGHGNLGDAAIFDAAIFHIRARKPDARIIGFTLRPADTERRHGIEAQSIGAFSRPSYTVVPDASMVRLIVIHRVLTRLRSVSWRLFWLSSTLVHLLTLPYREVMHWVDVFRTLRKCRFVVVCGGGQIDEFWGGPWGHPYSLFKFAVLARLCGAQFVVLSTGSATLETTLGRWFARQSLRLAEYRSFRERFSVALAAELGVPEPNVWCPDLAFSLPVRPRNRTPSSARIVVAISPIAWCDPRSWPKQDRAAFNRYIDEMADMVHQMLVRQARIVFFATDSPDFRVIDDIVGLIRRKHGNEALARVTALPALGVSELLSELSHVDIVVASRLHGLILSYLAHRPAVILSYDRKVDDLADSFRQRANCFPIHRFKSAEAVECALRLFQNYESTVAAVQQELDARASLVAAQYDRVFCEPRERERVEVATAPKKEPTPHQVC